MLILPRRLSIQLVLLLIIMAAISSIYRRYSPPTCGAANMPAVKFEHLKQVAKSCERTGNRTIVLIGVLSSTGNFESRAAVRDTWGGTALKMGFVVVFLLGATPDHQVQTKVMEEHKIHGDIVQGDFVDSYENLTYKTVMLIRLARQSCSEADFVLKIDDDMLLSVWDLAVVVNGLRGIKRSMWGVLFSHARPFRNKDSKWYVSKERYAPDIFPDYLSGTGYLISGDAISVLEDVICDERFFPLEDIYLTGIVAERAQVSRLGLGGFSYLHEEYHQPCWKPRFVTSHHWSPRDLRSGWRRAVDRLNFSLCVGIKQYQMVS